MAIVRKEVKRKPDAYLNLEIQMADGTTRPLRNHAIFLHEDDYYDKQFIDARKTKGEDFEIKFVGKIVLAVPDEEREKYDFA